MIAKHKFSPMIEWEQTQYAIQTFALELVHIQQALYPAQKDHSHLSLELHPDGIRTKQLPYPHKKLESIQIDLNFSSHKVITSNSIGNRQEFTLSKIDSSHHLNQIIKNATQSFNLPITLPSPSTSQAKRTAYLTSQADPFFSNLSALRRFFQTWKNTQSYPFGTFQFWPMRMQSSIEAFGSRMVYFKNDEGTYESPAQISFGFSVATPSIPEPYIFANPWPFKNEFTHRPLPAYARWYTESWEGSLIPITVLYDTKTVYDTLSNYFSAVIQASASTLSE
jgi:hypothetical protein